jgi:c-di-GMP-binding flagellar brake protein YcgR
LPSSEPSNRRSFYRLALYQRIDVRAAGVRVSIPATLVDISGGGCRFHSRTMLNPQTAVDYELPRPRMPSLRLSGLLRKVTYAPNDRTFHYAMEFSALTDEAREELLRFIAEEQRRSITGAPMVEAEQPARTPLRLQEQRAQRRVEVNVPVRYTVVDVPEHFTATAIDISTGGIRIIGDAILRREWTVTLRFTFPNLQGTPPFRELRMRATPLPGVKQSRGRYVQSLSWLTPDPEDANEIQRFVQAMRLTSLRR